MNAGSDKRVRRGGVVVAAAGVAVLVSGQLAFASFGDVTEHVTAASSGPREVTLAPNGNAVWYTETSTGTLGIISDQGRYTRLFIPTRNSQPTGITAGSDGNIWFTENAANRIGRAIGSRITEYPLPHPNSGPRGIAAGPDGALWFTEGTANRIGRITTAGKITEFSVPTPASGPTRITAAADGALWFTEQTAGRIGRITPAGATTSYAIPTPNSAPFGITDGPDGNVWFTENTAARIGVVTPQGVITEYPLAPASTPRDITTGTDGAVWFTEAGTDKIGQITPTGSITEYPIPTSSSGPFGIATGLRGNIWFTENATSKVAELANTQPHTQYVSVATSYIQPNPPRAHPGTAVQWTFFGPTTQSITDATGMGLYDSGPRSFVSTYSYTFTAAGDYPYHSTTSSLTSTYKILPFVTPSQGTTTTPFAITWSSTLPDPGFQFDVQIKRPNSSTFTPWLTGTTQRSATFTPDAGPGTYQIETRLVDTNTTTQTNSSWSPQVGISAS